jgi:hypothetical protein
MDGRAAGGTPELENLRVVCGTCNKSMGTRNLYTFKMAYFKNTPKTQPEVIELLASSSEEAMVIIATSSEEEASAAVLA